MEEELGNSPRALRRRKPLTVLKRKVGDKRMSIPGYLIYDTPTQSFICYVHIHPSIPLIPPPPPREPHNHFTSLGLHPTVVATEVAAEGGEGWGGDNIDLLDHLDNPSHKTKKPPKKATCFQNYI